MAKKPWIKPVVRSQKLTDSESAALRASEDPIGDLLKIKPKLLPDNAPAPDGSE